MALCGTPLKPRSRNGISNSSFSSPICSTSFSHFLVNESNKSLSFFRNFRSRRSSSSSSGSNLWQNNVQQQSDSATTINGATTYVLDFVWILIVCFVTSVKNCRSTVFFRPTIMGFFRWKWINTVNSCLHGCYTQTQIPTLTARGNYS